MLRRHMNPLESPLYRIPSELFPEVASHLASEVDLVNATHVSHHLRNVLLSCPSLWSHLNFEHEMRARAFFERSKQMPLHIDMPTDTDRTVGSLAELRQQSKRIATLKLPHWSIQTELLSDPLPSLKRLELFHDWEDLDNRWNVIRKKAMTWFYFPSLTSLIAYNLDSIPFYASNLTRFKFWNEHKLDPLTLAGFLGNCPLLEHVDISYGDSFQIGSDLVVSLPNLRTYTQTTFRKTHSLMVFDKLSLPPSCSVTLRLQIDGATTATNRVLPCFKDPGYLAEIKRVKLKTTRSSDGNEVAGALELINTEGRKVRFEGTVFKLKEGEEPSVQEDRLRAQNMAYLVSLGTSTIGRWRPSALTGMRRVTLEEQMSSSSRRHWV